VTSSAYDAINRLKLLLPGYVRRDDVRILEPGDTLEHLTDATDSDSATAASG
jgi:hypothetical protein